MTNLNLPIDRGWAWVIVAASFANLVLLVGMSKCFGMIFAELLELYGGTASETSTMLSLAFGLCLFLGPVVTTLSDMFTCRKVSMVGGAICSLGFLVPSFCTSLKPFIVWFGILTGLGFGICLTPSTIIVGRYFNRLRSMANGLMFSGSGLGGMIFPLFLNKILIHFGLHGAMVILAALALQTVVFASLYRPLTYWQKPVGSTKTAEKPIATIIPDENHLFLPEEERAGAKRRRPAGRCGCLTGSTTDDELKPNKNVGAETTIDQQRRNSCESDGEEIDHDRLRGMGLSNGTLYYSAMDLATYWSLLDISTVVMNDISTQTEHGPAPTDRSWRAAVHRLFKVKAADGTELLLLDVRLCKNVQFMLFVVATALALIGMYVGVITPKHCMELGMSKDDVAYLLAAQGGADTAGRLLFAVFGDRDLIKPRRKVIAVFCCFIAALSTLTSLLLTTFAGQMAYLIVFSLASGAYVAMIPVVMVDLVGVENLSRGWGITTFTEGFSMTLSPLIIGALRDFTSNYFSGLVFIACCFMVSIVCLSALLILERLRCRSPPVRHGVSLG